MYDTQDELLREILAGEDSFWRRQLGETLISQCFPSRYASGFDCKYGPFDFFYGIGGV